MRALFQSSEHAKNTIGQMMNQTSGGFLQPNRASLNYSEITSQYQDVKKGVKKFVKQSIERTRKAQQFEQILKNAIQTSPQRVQKFNLNQINEYYPWLFTTALLLEPIPSILFSLKYGLPVTESDSIKKYENPQKINDVAYNCIIQSLKDGAPYLMELLRIMEKNLNYVQKGMINLGNLFEKVTGIKEYLKDKVNDHYQWAASKFAKINEAFTTTKKFTFGFLGNSNNAQEQPDDKKTRLQAEAKSQLMFLHLLYAQVFAQLRVYGQIIINFGFLKSTADKKLINGKVYYVFHQTPNFYISNNDSVPAIFLLSNGRLQLIPQKQCNLNYFRKLTQFKVIKLGGQIFADYKKQISSTKQQLDQQKKFRTQYSKE